MPVSLKQTGGLTSCPWTTILVSTCIYCFDQVQFHKENKLDDILSHDNLVHIKCNFSRIIKLQVFLFKIILKILSPKDIKEYS